VSIRSSSWARSVMMSTNHDLYFANDYNKAASVETSYPALLQKVGQTQHMTCTYDNQK
jgi:hypothetical protein